MLSYIIGFGIAAICGALAGTMVAKCPKPLVKTGEGERWADTLAVFATGDWTIDETGTSGFIIGEGDGIFLPVPITRSWTFSTGTGIGVCGINGRRYGSSWVTILGYDKHSLMLDCTHHAIGLGRIIAKHNPTLTVYCAVENPTVETEHVGERHNHWWCIYNRQGNRDRLGGLLAGVKHTITETAIMVQAHIPAQTLARELGIANFDTTWTVND